LEPIRYFRVMKETKVIPISASALIGESELQRGGPLFLSAVAAGFPHIF
jgi:hypothetical protein